MHLSKQTLDILSNVYRVNQGLVFNQGSVLSSVSDDKSVYVEAQIEETIPVRFAVYDLGQFVSNVSELGDPELNVSENSVEMISGSGMSVNYVCCLPELVIQPNRQRPPDFVSSCTFTLTWDVISKLIKMASINQVKQFFINVIDDKTLFVGVCGDDSNNKTKVKVEEFSTSESDYLAKIDINNLKLMQGDYEVTVNGKRSVRFENKNKPIVYYVAMLVEDR